ncbi:MAG: ABC transporter permease [Deltaproteobacteria bacterium]|nr:ABC transporter permease [Deltaproteobacteria bacterium]MBW1948292.1 ABC transporter permease [Deltaproteobacteria bacterium]MBW2006789.1 ABC transporter permease [Deltaproteobacteria bacterium]RLB37341.1 MAG: ABC transporter permease [Deltaproteobacteria bacterium]
MNDEREKAILGVSDREVLPPAEGRLRSFWRLFRKNRMAMAGLAVFGLFLATALVGLVLTSGTDPLMDPATVRLQEKLRPPLSKPNLAMLRPKEVPALGVYLFGTDDLGRDVFARMLQGAWVSLTVGFVAVGISVIVGIFLGGIAGYYGPRPVRADRVGASVLLTLGAALLFTGSGVTGGAILVAGHLFLFWDLLWGRVPLLREKMPWVRVLRVPLFSVDTLLMRLVDIMLCFPSFFLILTVVALLPASIYNIMIVIGLTSWMGTARFVRAEFLSLREQDFVTAARALGVGDLRIIFRHMIPNAVAPVLVSATIGIATAILTEAGLSFLGFGVPPPHATWGNILSDGKRFIFDAPWLTFVPGVAILVVVLSFNLFGEGLRDTLNPRLKERH